MTASQGPTLQATQRRPGGQAELWAMAYPVLVATLSQSLMGVVDTFYMGRVGSAEQGAVGLAAITFWTITSLFIGTLHGVTTFAAQHFGSGRYSRCGRDGWMGLILCLPSAIILGGIAFIAPALFLLVGSDPAVVPHASDYIFYRLSGSLFVLLNYAVVSFLRGVGDTKTPMYLTLGANILNIILDYPLILGAWGIPALGAKGAALGSVIATATFSVAYLVFFLTGERNKLYKTRRIRCPKWKEVKAFLNIGAPIGGSWTLEMIAWTAFMAIISRTGVVDLAATAIVLEVLHFSFMGAVALGTAATTLVGQYLGREDLETAKMSARSTMIASVIYCCSMGLTFLVARWWILGFFTSDADVVRTGAKLFIYIAVFQFFDGLAVSCTGVIRGAGDTRWPMVYMALLATCFFLPFTYLFSTTWGLGIDGAWLAATLFISMAGVGIFLRYRSGKWQSMRV